MSHIASDIRHAVRFWARTPALTLIVIASIGLGVGANTAIFTLVDQVLLRLLPVESPDELVQVTVEGSRYGSNWGDGSELSYPMYTELRDNNRVFDGMFCRFGYGLHVGYGERTERAVGELVSGTYFPVLGVKAAVGRTLGPDDDRTPGAHPVAVLSHAYWSSRFAADPSVVGRTLTINGDGYTVIGVAQPGFEGIELGRPTQVFLPMMMSTQTTPLRKALDQRLFRWVRVFARLKPGVTPEAAASGLQPSFRSSLETDLADAEFRTAAETLRQQYVQNRLVMVPGAQGRSGFRRGLQEPLWVLMAAAAGVLIIACANVANLLLARGAARQREMAVRLALGASRGRLVRQLLVESVLLSLAGGLAGLALSAFGAPLILGLFADNEIPSPVSATPDLRILAFTLIVSTVTGIVFGLTPALQSTRAAVATTLKDQAGSVLGGGSARFRKTLVASQVAVSLLLVAAAGLFLRTLQNLQAVDVGFDTRALVSFTVEPSMSGYTSRRTKELLKTLLERLQATPGVSSATVASVRLLDGSQWTSDVTVEGYAHGNEEDMEQNCLAVGPGYFRTMGMPLLAGRELDERDERLEDLPDDQGLLQYRVAVVNERFVKKYFGERNPIGRHIGFGTDPGRPTPIEIVGVVADSKYADVRDEAPRQIFFPILETRNPRGFTAYVRTTQPPSAMIASVRRLVQELDPNVPVVAPRSLEQQVGRSVSRERMVAMMSGVFGTLATLLAVVGLYGVMAYSVARRTREIGIRMALGARAGDISRMVVREVLVITAAGIAVALLASWSLGRLVASQLYGVSPTDPLTLSAAVLVLATVSLLAGLVPSRRAARVEPTTALHYE
jgi:predicted permease